MTPDQLEGVRGALQGVLPEVKLLSDEDVETLHKNYILSPDAVEAADMDLLAGEPDPVPAGLVTLLKACRERERKRKESELQAAKRPKLEADQSEDILKRLLGDPLPAIPSLTELRQYLSEVPQPLPVNRRAYEKLSYRAGADKLVRICEEQDDAVIVVGFSKRVLEDPETAGMEELTGHVVTEMLWEGLRQIQMNLKSPLRLGLVYDKNSSTKGTFSVPNTASKRPDGTGVVKSTLLIAGEEKAESGQLTEAKQDLQTKFTEPFSPLHYGTLDYIISYAASGKHIEFQAMKTRTAEIIPITDVIDFDCPEGKAQLLLVVVNLYRLLLKMKEALPDVHGALEMFKIVERPNGVKIEARQNRIVKTIDDTTNFFKVAGTSYSSIKAAFGAAQASMYVVHAVEGPHLFSALDKYRAVLQPMGCAPTIRSEKQLQQCAHDLVHGLSALHEGGVCHRDVRSPNVILYQDYDGRSRFILIDLESAALSGAQLPPVHFAAWDEYTLVNGEYMPESDLYQLAKMLKELSGHGGVSLSENGKDFIRQLSSKQSSAAALLTHGWLQCVCNKGVEFSQDASL